MHLVQSIAWTGQQPWHGLGNQLAPKQPIEVWARQAGMRALSERKVTDAVAEKFIQRVLTYPASGPHTVVAVTNDRAIKAVHELYAGRGKGATLASASGTAWGLVNSVTQFVDHERRARSDDHRRDAAWFGAGATLKQKAWDEAMKLIA